MKRKKHNPTKRAQGVFSNATLWSWESEYDLKTSERILNGYCRVGYVKRWLTDSQILQLANRPHNWSIMCRALVWYQDGTTDIFNAIYDERQCELARLEEIARKLRKTVMSKVKRADVVDVGWLAQTYSSTPRTDGDIELIGLGAVTEARKTLWGLGEKWE